MCVRIGNHYIARGSRQRGDVHLELPFHRHFVEGHAEEIAEHGIEPVAHLRERRASVAEKRRHAKRQYLVRAVAGDDHIGSDVAAPQSSALPAVHLGGGFDKRLCGRVGIEVDIALFGVVGGNHRRRRRKGRFVGVEFHIPSVSGLFARDIGLHIPVGGREKSAHFLLLAAERACAESPSLSANITISFIAASIPSRLYEMNCVLRRKSSTESAEENLALPPVGRV